jgi:hypothetical protein
MCEDDSRVDLREDVGSCGLDSSYARLLVFTVVKIEVEVFWVVTPCHVVVGYHHFGGPYCLYLHPKDGGSIDLRNVYFLPQNYTASQPRRFRLGFM